MDWLLYVSIGLFGVGIFSARRWAHVVRAIGWLTLGGFFFSGISDIMNSVGAFVALPLFLFLAYHEQVSFRRNEEYPPLKFAASAAFISMAIYFGVERTPLAGVYIEIVGNHTVALLNLFSPGYTLGPQGIAYGEIVSPVIFAGVPIVNVILACTALAGVSVGAACAGGVTESWKRRALALGILLSVAYVMNLVRNVTIIYLWDEAGYEWELVHGIYGKALSLGTVVFLTLLSFRLLPSLYENIKGLVRLPWRLQKPGRGKK